VANFFCTLQCASPSCSLDLSAFNKSHVSWSARICLFHETWNESDETESETESENVENVSEIEIDGAEYEIEKASDVNEIVALKEIVGTLIGNGNENDGSVNWDENDGNVTENENENDDDYENESVDVCFWDVESHIVHLYDNLLNWYKNCTLDFFDE